MKTRMVKDQRGLPTRLMLIAALILVIGSVTLSSLLVIRNRMQSQVLDDFSADLSRSTITFREFQAQRLAALERENTLLADLPSLKALMTTNDERTIADAGAQFWKVGDNDLFALAASDGEVVAAYTRGAPADARLRKDLRAVLLVEDRRFLLTGDRLFEYSIRPLYFGSHSTGTLLGYVISGYSVDTAFLQKVNRAASSEIAFFSGDRALASTLPAEQLAFLQKDQTRALQEPDTYANVTLGGHRFRMISQELSTESSAPLRLVVMKSFDHPEQLQHAINRLLLLVGSFALLSGTILMLTISGLVTRPLEQLVRGVRAFGSGDGGMLLPVGGTREIRELSSAFSAMRDQIQQKSNALLDAERLATIGRMASSVSHDLRHYLAAVYANAEFLSSSRLSDAERMELFAEISIAVHGTTELIDSLLIFSRTSAAPQRLPEPISGLLDRALGLVRSHPDAGRVQWTLVPCASADSIAIVDAKQMERALFNLLLNAGQAARRSSAEPQVTAIVETSPTHLTVRISDNGPGVSELIRESLFEPFVSEGKQNGTGLGLTLAHAVAKEHQGSVTLVSSQPGQTTFALSIQRGILLADLADNEQSTQVSR